MYIDAKKEDFTVDTTFAVSFQGMLPDVRKDSIYIAPESLRTTLFQSLKDRFSIDPVSYDAGLCFSVRDVRGEFSFTDNFESIIRTLSLTICNVVMKYYRRKVKPAITFAIERAKNAVCPTAPRFLRL